MLGADCTDLLRLFGTLYAKYGINTTFSGSDNSTAILSGMWVNSHLTTLGKHIFCSNWPKF